MDAYKSPLQAWDIECTMSKGSDTWSTDCSHMLEQKHV